MSPKPVRVPVPPLGTVTSEKVGRMSWTNGKSEYLGRRGTIRRMITRLLGDVVP